MRYSFLILTIVMFNCSRHERTGNLETRLELDTIYASSFTGTPSFEQLTIVMTDSTGLTDVDFQVGKTDYLKVKIPRFEEYPIFLDSLVNVELGNADSITGVFELTPLERTFSFLVTQNYGTGNVVFKHSRTDSGFSVMHLNGYNAVGSRTFELNE